MPIVGGKSQIVSKTASEIVGPWSFVDKISQINPYLRIKHAQSQYRLIMRRLDYDQKGITMIYWNEVIVIYKIYFYKFVLNRNVIF